MVWASFENARRTMAKENFEWMETTNARNRCRLRESWDENIRGVMAELNLKEEDALHRRVDGGNTA